MNTKPNILIVDDEEVVRRSYARVLAQTDCHVEAVWQWADVSRLMNGTPFDVVLLDLRMPGMNGMTVLRAIKRHWPDSEVIVITGYPTVETAKQAVRLGAYDYLTKPVEPEQILDAANGAVLHRQWALRRDTEPGARAITQPVS